MSQLALQLIQKEKAAKTGYLDLGRCGLTPDNPLLQDVWNALSELTHLETLILSNRWREIDNAQEETWKDLQSQNNGKKNLLNKIPAEATYLVNLKRLVIAGNYNAEKWKISKIENLPQNIATLDIRKNQISKIENLPKNLRVLWINENQISELENLPQSIRILNISKNKIKKLKNLPIYIKGLYIHVNQINKCRTP